VDVCDAVSVGRESYLAILKVPFVGHSTCFGKEGSNFLETMFHCRESH
jgi:hypothetical protein